MRISELLPVAVSSFHRPKFSSYTMTRPSLEMDGKNRLPLVWRVTCAGRPPRSEIFQMLLTLFITSGLPGRMFFSPARRSATKKISPLPAYIGHRQFPLYSSSPSFENVFAPTSISQRSTA